MNISLQYVAYVRIFEYQFIIRRLRTCINVFLLLRGCGSVSDIAWKIISETIFDKVPMTQCPDAIMTKCPDVIMAQCPDVKTP